MINFEGVPGYAYPYYLEVKKSREEWGQNPEESSYLVDTKMAHQRRETKPSTLIKNLLKRASQSQE